MAGSLAVRALVLAVVVLVVGRLAGVVPFEPVRVPSESMAPTLRSGDHVLLDHRPVDPHDGDVVVAVDPTDGTLLVKRVVAVAGEAVGISGGVLDVDGVPVAEPYADRTDQGGVWFGPAVVPPGHVFLLGDNRADSVDSRVFGPVPLASVVGTVQFRLLPVPGPIRAP